MRVNPAIRAALKQARRADEADPIVVYIQCAHGLTAAYFCRVCGPRQQDVVPLRLSDVTSSQMPLNPECEACHQPVLKP